MRFFLRVQFLLPLTLLLILKQRRRKRVPTIITETTSHHRRAATARRRGVDFIVAGFPKCGTSTLLSTLSDHPGVDMPKHEACQIDSPSKSIKDIESFIKGWFSSSAVAVNETNTRRMRGLKCPNTLEHMTGLKRLEQLNSETRVVVGVRHPVWLFQSFYNYRISHRKKVRGKRIPSPTELVGGRGKSFQGVYTGLLRYEDFLMQMGKVPLSNTDKKRLKAVGLMLAPMKLKVFLYDIEQLSEMDPNRSESFRADLQHFLRLKDRIEPFGRHNVYDNRTFPETMDICQPKFDGLRRGLVQHGARTSKWIRDSFVKSDDVTVGGDMSFFLDSIGTWGDDPCQVESGS